MSSLEISRRWLLCTDCQFINSLFFFSSAALSSISVVGTHFLYAVKLLSFFLFSFLLVENLIISSWEVLEGGVKFLRGQGLLVGEGAKSSMGFLMWRLGWLERSLTGGEVWLGVEGSKPFSLEKEMSRGLISSSVMFILFQILTANLDLINKILIQQSHLNYMPHNKYINEQASIASKVRKLLPSKPEERQELIRKLKEEIDRICPDASRATGQVVQKKAILEQRIKLIQNCQEYSENRLSNLQKIFKHYSTHLFRSGQKYDFDQIGYLNEHLIIQRFFAFIKDFKLNEIIYNGEPCQLAERNDIILIFKKSSSNARNLDLPQFIACLERLFVLLFNENQGYKDKQELLKKEKQQRAQEAKKREKIKQQRAKLKAKMIANNMISMLPPMPSAKAENPQLKPKQNDPMMKEMMKDFEIVNPNDEANKQETAAEVKKEAPPENLYLITDSQKIESYFQRIGIDDRKQIEKKLRYFQKANYKYFEVEQLQKYRSSQPKKRDEQKGNQPLNLKRELTELHDEWKNQKRQLQKSNANRFIKVVDKLSERQLNKSRLHMSRSLSREEYDNKKKNLDDKFTKRQLALMYPTAKERISKRKQQQQSTMYYNLQMLHRSSPNQLPINKVYPDRYVSADPTDSIYLQEYSFPRNVGRAMSSFSNEKSQIAQSTKRRAHELQNQESKRMNRLTVNLHQNQHYLQKFLERKW